MISLPQVVPDELRGLLYLQLGDSLMEVWWVVIVGLFDLLGWVLCHPVSTLLTESLLLCFWSPVLMDRMFSLLSDLLLWWTAAVCFGSCLLFC